jgi:AAA+ ATPase superfamily predicted ATPase
MPRYLAEFSLRQPLKRLIAQRVLNRLGPLFNEPRALLAQELVAPHNYFSILAALSHGPLSWGDLVARSRVEDKSLGKYLATLIRLRMVEDRLPVTEEARDVRRRQYRIRDGFVSFWFRFVFPFQAELEEGLDPTELYRSQIEPNLPSHVAPVFEGLGRAWVRRTYGTDLTRVCAWWGLAQHALRRTGARRSEEIDLVGLSRRMIKVVGECRWRKAPMDVAVLAELRNFKMPALAQVNGVTMAPDCRILLFSRAGFTKGLQRVAQAERVQLVNADEVVGALGAPVDNR